MNVAVVSVARVVLLLFRGCVIMYLRGGSS